jgi:hypothetical protein
MTISVPSARRILAPPSLGACLDGLASNSDAADDRGSLGRSRSLLTLGPTLPYGGRLPAPGCGPDAHEAAPQGTRRRRNLRSAGRHAPDAGYRRHSGNVRASPVPGYRPVPRTHRKALCRQPKQRERSSILAHNGSPRTGTAPNSTHSSSWTGKRRDTWSDSHAGDAGPTPSCEAAHARRD